MFMYRDPEKVVESKEARKDAEEGVEEGGKEQEEVGDEEDGYGQDFN